MSERNRSFELPSEARSTGEEAVRELLQEAGSRPPVPAADMAIIKAAARQEWEKLQDTNEIQGSRRTTRRFLAMAAVLLLAVLAGWRWRQVASTRNTLLVATVEVVGDKDGDWAIGNTLAVGAEVQVNTPMALRLAGGQSLRLAAGSSLQLLSATRARLNAGVLYVDSDSNSSSAGVEIETEFGVVQEIGTQFEVRVGTGNQPLRIRVREGEVIMTTNGDSRSAAAGEELALLEDGSLRTAPVETFGEEWSWVEELAPTFHLDEGSLAAYLEWLARETGWQIEFEDDDLQRSSDGITLYGDLDGLLPQQSVAIALAGSGLAYEVGEGRLRILRD